jgi:hypothetical protein
VARLFSSAALERAVKPVIDSLGNELELAMIFNQYESGLVYASDVADIPEATIKPALTPRRGHDPCPPSFAILHLLTTGRGRSSVVE